MSKFCEYCGAPLQEGARFCTGCGHPVAVMSQPNQQQPQQPASKPRPQQQQPWPQQQPRGGQQQGYPYGQQQATQQGNPYRQSSNQVNFQPSAQANRPQQPKKKGGFGKTLLVLAIIAVVIVGVVKFLPNIASSSHSVGKKGIGRKGYKVELPDGAKDVKCKQVTKERMEDLQAQGFDLICKPLDVTQNGDEHVQLDRMATVSFAIPKNVPKEEYRDLLGVIFTDEGPVYMIPSYAGIKEGIVTFETSHFCEVGAIKDRNKLREMFIERTATTGWQIGLCDKDLEPTLKETLLEKANNAGFGENDVLGIAAREVLADNDFVKGTMDLVNTYDLWNKDPDKAAEEVSQKIRENLETKALSYLFEKLKEDKTTKTKFLDKSSTPDDPRYITETKTTEKSYKGVVEFFEGHLTPENMKELATRLGNNEHPYTIAKDYVAKLAEAKKDEITEKMKEFSIQICPYIKTVQATAKTVEVAKKIWTTNEMNELWDYYKKNAKSDGTVDPEIWSYMDVKKMAAIRYKFNMTSQELRRMFEERYRNQREIDRKKAELAKIIDCWDDYTILDAEIFNRRDLRDYGTDKYYEPYTDYVRRLSTAYMLYQRFEKELRQHGNITKDTPDGEVRRRVSAVVEKYLEFYPDQIGFYEWMVKQGYYDKKFYDEVDALNNHRSWWLVDCTIEMKENDVNPEGHSVYYVAGETMHKRTLTWDGNAFIDPNDNQTWYKPYNFVFVATIDAPPSCMSGGDSIVLHTTLNLTGEENGWYYMESIMFNFDPEGVGWGFIQDWNTGKVTNLVGSKKVGTRYGMPHSGEWDYVLYIPKGRKDELKAINFDVCGARTHWVYKWCSIFELEEMENEMNQE